MVSNIRRSITIAISIRYQNGERHTQSEKQKRWKHLEITKIQQRNSVLKKQRELEMVDIRETQYLPKGLYAELPKEINIIEAHQGAGKTERINDLKGQSTIVVGAREELGEQLIERCPTLNFYNYKIEGNILKGEALWEMKSLFICYPSLRHLQGKNFLEHCYDNLIVDEANLVWESSYKFHPKNSNNNIFHRLLKRVPRVILVGAYFKPFVIKELQRFDALRNPLGLSQDD